MEAPVIKDIPTQTVIAMRHTGDHDAIAGVHHELRTWAKEHDVEITGPGTTVFLGQLHEFDPKIGTFEVCLPIAAPVEASDPVACKELPAVKVAAVKVKGPYADIPGHYSEFLAWADSESWEIIGPPREVYIKHPDASGGGDPSEFVTEIQFPVNA